MRNSHTAITTHGYTSYVIRPSSSGSVRDERQQSTQIIVRLLTQAQLAGWGPLCLMRVYWYWLCSKSGCRHSGPPPASFLFENRLQIADRQDNDSFFLTSLWPWPLQVLSKMADGWSWILWSRHRWSGWVQSKLAAGTERLRKWRQRETDWEKEKKGQQRIKEGGVKRARDAGEIN